MTYGPARCVPPSSASLCSPCSSKLPAWKTRCSRRAPIPSVRAWSSATRAARSTPSPDNFSWTSTPPGKLLPTHAVKPISQLETAAEYFARGIALEEDPNSADLAIEAYVTVLDLQPDYGPAHINLGTIYYNREQFVEAESHYRAAIQCDPRYALAWFDLGNVLDETATHDGSDSRL